MRTAAPLPRGHLFGNRYLFSEDASSVFLTFVPQGRLGLPVQLGDVVLVLLPALF